MGVVRYIQMKIDFNEIDKIASQIHGWLFNSEPELLYRLACRAENIVEIGSYKGKSSLYLAASGKPVLCVDTFNADNVDKNVLHKPTLNEFMTNTKNYKNITPYISDSVHAGEVYSGEPIDFLFIDGGHSKEQVLNDFNAWKQYLTKDAKIAFHDCFNNNGDGPNYKHTGVHEAVGSILEEGGYHLVDRAGSIAVLSPEKQVKSTAVLAVFKENIDWIGDKGINYEVVQKGLHCPNVGREPLSYIWYIIHNYHNLLGKYFFLQGDPRDHCPNVLEELQNIDGDFRWFSNRGPFKCDMMARPHDHVDIKKFLNDIRIPYDKEEIEFMGCCLFMVSAEYIKSRPLSFYQNLYNVLEKPDRSEYAFERCVDLIFNKEGRE